MTLTRLEKLLLFNVLELAPNGDRWATQCRRALYPSLREKDYRRSCLGAVMRRTLELKMPWLWPGASTEQQKASAAWWFLEICRLVPGDVAALAPHITPPPVTLDLFCCGLAAPGRRLLGPGGEKWDAWLADVAEAEFMAAATGLSEVERVEPPTSIIVPPAAEAVSAPPVQLVMPDAPAAEPKTIVIKPRAAIKKARAIAKAAQGGLF